jgi:hypothetical protein
MYLCLIFRHFYKMLPSHHLLQKSWWVYRFFHYGCCCCAGWRRCDAVRSTFTSFSNWDHFFLRPNLRLLEKFFIFFNWITCTFLSYCLVYPDLVVINYFLYALVYSYKFTRFCSIVMVNIPLMDIQLAKYRVLEKYLYFRIKMKFSPSIFWHVHMYYCIQMLEQWHFAKLQKNIYITTSMKSLFVLKN